MLVEMKIIMFGNTEIRKDMLNMTIGILAYDLKDYHESVKNYYKPLNLKQDKNEYKLLDIRILPIICDKDTDKQFDKVIVSKGLSNKIEQYMKVRK